MAIDDSRIDRFVQPASGVEVIKRKKPETAATATKLGPDEAEKRVVPMLNHHVIDAGMDATGTK